MKEVKVIMGIDQMDDESKRTFSDNILRLEVSDPNQEHFSIIDVPGIFKKPTPGVTTRDDSGMVDQMVHGYMKNPRFVILAVIPSNVDIVTQDILERAEEVDPDDIRTLSVLTKPDLVDKETEPVVFDLIERRSHQLKLEWHLVRNPEQSDLQNSTSSRQKIETEFFAKKAPWDRLNKDKIDIHSLRIRLQEIMAHHIRREFLKMKAEINQRLKVAMKSLEDMSPKRQTLAEQIQFMTRIALCFQHLASLAVRSEYSHSGLFDKYRRLRLATAAMNRENIFVDKMATAGHDFRFDPDHQGDIPEEDDLDEIGLEKLTIQENGTFNARTEQDHPGVADLTHPNSSLTSAHSRGILAWLKKVHLESRGYELGTYKASLLAVTMKDRHATHGLGGYGDD